MNIQNEKTSVGERVYHVSGFFVNLDSVKKTHCFGSLNSTEVSWEFPDPPEFDLKFSDD